MDHDLGKIRELAVSSSLVKNPEVSFLAEGYGNYVHLIEENGERMVLRMKKGREAQFSDSLEREFVFLKYFEFKGIDFCPKVFYYDKDKEFLIQEFIEGKKLNQRDFSKEQIDLLAKQIWEMFSLSVRDFCEYCKKNRFRKHEMENPVAVLKKYGFDRFEGIEEGFLDEEDAKWIKSRLDESLNYLNEFNKASSYGGFSSGDFSSTVFIDGDKMLFYDFEHVAIWDKPPLVYVKVHGKLDKEGFNYLIERYSYYSGIDKVSLIGEIVNGEKILRVNSVVWAAMQWAESGDDKYRELMKKRMKMTEELD